MSSEPKSSGPFLRYWTANLKRNGPKKIIYFFYKKNCLTPGDLINVIGTEMLRSIAEIMDREFEKKWSKKN